MTSRSTKAMTWVTVAAAVASALLVAASGAGWHERLGHESRSVMRQIGLAVRTAQGRDLPVLAPARAPASLPGSP
ncbi:MAG: hypothetical protein ABIX46_02325 [Burkholderiaceae bacterium]